jgi:drug/metabolite transporter (DMT)-like permease
MKMDAIFDRKYLGYFYLSLAMLIFSASNSAFVLLHGIDEQALNACSILCASNLVGLFLMLILFRKKLTLEVLLTITKVDWMWLFIGSFLYSCIAPYFILTGLSRISVDMVGILQRMESINILILGYFFIGTKVSTWCVCNAFITFIGILLTVISPLFFGEKIEFSVGMLYVLLGGISYSSSLIISMLCIHRIPLAVVAVFRVSIGTLMFHIFMAVMIQDYMWNELRNATLWLYMIPYGIIFVFGGQMCWLMALSTASTQAISIGTTTLFILTILWGVIILKKVPTHSPTHSLTYSLTQVPTKEEWIGFSILSVSIVSSVLEKLYHEPSKSQEDMDIRTKLLSDPGLEGSGNVDLQAVADEIVSISAYSSIDASLVLTSSSWDPDSSLSDRFHQLSTASLDSFSFSGGFKGF